MSRYRRANTPGATYFFTVVTYRRRGFLCDADVRIALRWQQIKRLVTLRCGERLHQTEWMTRSKTRHRESTLWQRRYWEHQIRNELDFERHMDYLHYNPVKHGLVQQVKDWPYSSFHRCVDTGIYTPDWAGVSPADETGFGE